MSFQLFDDCRYLVRADTIFRETGLHDKLLEESPGPLDGQCDHFFFTDPADLPYTLGVLDELGPLLYFLDLQKRWKYDSECFTVVDPEQGS